MKVLYFARIVGALAIGMSGMMHVLGYHDLASALMVLGTGAAAPGGKAYE